MRYLVQNWIEGLGSKGFLVWDSKEKIAVFKDMKKSRCIETAQYLNNFEPIDGKEETFRKQTIIARAKPHRNSKYT